VPEWRNWQTRRTHPNTKGGTIRASGSTRTRAGLLDTPN